MTEELNKDSKEPKPKPAEIQKAKFDWRSLNTLSVVSLASALTGIGSLMAIITGHISLAQIKRSNENGRNLAIVGTVLGYANIIGWIIFTLAVVANFAFVSKGMHGLQPGMFDFSEFGRGFGGHYDR